MLLWTALAATSRLNGFTHGSDTVLPHVILEHVLAVLGDNVALMGPLLRSHSGGAGCKQGRMLIVSVQLTMFVCGVRYWSYQKTEDPKVGRR